jgi:flagellar basal body rod protein FlgG
VIRSLNTASRAMQLEQVRIDALANNLANASASGFRQVITRLAEPGVVPGAALPAEAAGPAVPAGLATASGRTAAGGAGEPRWNRVTRADLTHALDARPGPIKPTGRDTDVAIMGRGFFEIQTADGPRYTRNGSFILDAERRLTTPDGKPVAGDGGALTLEGGEFSIAADGTVTVDGQAVGRLKLVDFTDPSRLEHVGDALLKAPEDMAPQPVPIEATVVAQGHIEGSNVNPVDTLVAMIEAQRAFQIQSKVVQVEDELLNKSVNNLPRTSA